MTISKHAVDAFFPNLIVEDAVVSTLVILLVIVFAVLFGAPLEGPGGRATRGSVLPCTAPLSRRAIRMMAHLLR